MGRVENIVGKGENAGYQHFLHFPQCFQKVSFSRLLKGGVVWKGVKKLFLHVTLKHVGLCLRILKEETDHVGNSPEKIS